KAAYSKRIECVFDGTGLRILKQIFPFSRLREKVPDRADEGVGQSGGSSSASARRIMSITSLKR
ncbi:MAG: hypothetical protein ACOZAM_23000, partial [Pseudomonadota bacterium]